MPQLEPDTHNFLHSSSHRLPTISGTQALQHARSITNNIPSGLPDLDRALATHVSLTPNSGVQRGCLTEIYGPPGVGKTTIGLQLVVNALHLFRDNSRAIWINTGSPMVRNRLCDLVSGYGISKGQDEQTHPAPSEDPAQVLNRFIYIEAQSLLRLLTIFIHPSDVFPPPDTCLIVVDDLSNLLLSSIPRVQRQKPSLNTTTAEGPMLKPSTRRYQIIESLGLGMSRLAASRRIAIVALNNATTSFKAGQRATLRPALSGSAWDSALNTRVILYRDFRPAANHLKRRFKKPRDYRLAEVQRLAGKETISDPVPFVITVDGVRPIRLKIIPDNDGHGDTDEAPGFPTHDAEGHKADSPAVEFANLDVKPTPRRSSKRKAIEIADSDDDESDAGLQEASDNDDEPSLPPMPRLLYHAHNNDDDDNNEDTDEMLLESYERQGMSATDLGLP